MWNRKGVLLTVGAASLVCLVLATIQHFCTPVHPVDRDTHLIQKGMTDGEVEGILGTGTKHKPSAYYWSEETRGYVKWWKGNRYATAVLFDEEGRVQERRDVDFGPPRSVIDKFWCSLWPPPTCG